MTENNSPVISQEWVTIKTLKTVSGAALCCWLTTIFFDLVCFTPIANIRIRSLLILIITALSCIGLAIYKVSSLGGKKTKIRWMLVIPNAMLIYIHALGFHVESKELAMRANASDAKKEVNTQANVLSVFSFLAKQTSWIPNKELINKTRIFNQEQQRLKNANKVLEDSIRHFNNSSHIIQTITPKLNINDQDSAMYYLKLYNNCVKTNTALQGRIDSIASMTSMLKSINYKRDENKDSLLIRKIEEKNMLINKWNRLMKGSNMAYQNAEVERIINWHMSDENYYRKLFSPIQLQ
ncbi:hypothetical protein [Chitinophaga rhizophila]|uniref:DUF4407 domain-containing protein n=1 Tax=Chitinophaga rhizophila TaxID=2866212 RepID=A0ABS7GKY3_9BACT|nr:hypothetical protein [Chitinophaga rhizophila]MBW8688372.1 hypothetical protein [Chitinophaga rhizophila]